MRHKCIYPIDTQQGPTVGELSTSMVEWSTTLENNLLKACKELLDIQTPAVPTHSGDVFSGEIVSLWMQEE